MNHVIINNHNARVKPEDTVFFIGDFCFKNSPGGKDGEGHIDKAEEYISKLNGRFVFIEGNHDCFSKETRVLTKNGYKYYWELKKKDLIPTINLKKNCIEFKPINKIIINQTKTGYYFKTQTSEGMFSENHKHLYSFGTSTNVALKENTSSKIWGLKSPIKLVSSFQSGFEDYNISNDWLKMLAWIVTDGSIQKKYGYVSICQSKEDNVKSLKLIFKRLNIGYTLIIRNRNIKSICGKKLKTKPKTNYEFHFKSKKSKKILSKLKIKNYNKYFLPSWLCKVSDKQFKIFIEEVVKGDDTIQNSGTKVIWGKKELLEQYMGLCVTHNISSNLIKDKLGQHYLTIHSRKHHREPNFNYKSIYAKNRKIKHYNDIMWCVNVPNHIIFTELNGKTLVTKNSNNSLKTCIKGIIIKLGGEEMYLTHRPEDYNPEFKINLVGHVHEKWKVKVEKDNTILVNVGVDVWNFKPINIQEILKAIEAKVKKKIFRKGLECNKIYK